MLKRFQRLLKTERGFTLIELMIVLTIIGILASIAAPNYQWGIIRARESVLREDLYMMRSAIDQYWADQGKWPETLQALVDDKNKYLKEVPKDPFTKTADTWKTDPAPPPAEGQPASGIADVHSGSTLVGSDGKPYAEW
ncbi:type II secretion system protein [Geomonas sp.]|uniref:type II secretion system protein n=1 Tax=Geomonas sp. TaxID=2651584 RepID=UPI002B49D65B|nr:type II secretion system protein [Geomonas sp.]HJV34096.1 type II secretion system protein [Geomonas sp.]